MSDLIRHYFPQITSEQYAQVEKMGKLYHDWNEKINVISRKDMDFFYERHVLHSLGIAKVIQFRPDTRLLDVGTGGGFPGIPLAVMFPECHFTLVDSIGKKIKVVEEVARGLGLKNVTAIHSRVEELPVKVDFILSRAVTRMAPFYGWVSQKLNRQGFNDLDNGILYLKGGDLTEEMEEANLSFRVFELQDYFKEAFFETKKVVYVPIDQKK